MTEEVSRFSGPGAQSQLPLWSIRNTSQQACASHRCPPRHTASVPTTRCRRSHAAALRAERRLQRRGRRR